MLLFDNETQQRQWSPSPSPGFRGRAGAPTAGWSCKTCRFLCVIFWSAIVLLLANVYLLLSLVRSEQNPAVLVWEAKRAVYVVRERVVTASRIVNEPAKKLAVVVPTNEGNLSDTIDALEKWPIACSPDTLQHVDLVIYKAEDFDEATENQVSHLFSCLLKQAATLLVR